MDEYEFEIMSIPKTELFHSNRQIWILAERNALLYVKRSRGKVTKTKTVAIPDCIFENNTFSIGNNCTVGKFLLDAQKDDSDNLQIKITSLTNEKSNFIVDFNSIGSLVEILKDRKLLSQIESQDKAQRANEIYGLLKLNEEAKTEYMKYTNQINEDIQIFFDLRKSGELQDIEDWREDNNMESSLNYMESKLNETVKNRENLSISDIIIKSTAIKNE